MFVDVCLLYGHFLLGNDNVSATVGFLKFFKVLKTNGDEGFKASSS